jgi:hypothetical protein
MLIGRVCLFISPGAEWLAHLGVFLLATSAGGHLLEANFSHFRPDLFALVEPSVSASNFQNHRGRQHIERATA